MTPFTTAGRWLRGNLHCHSTNSDGKLTPAQVCARYRAKGYDFVSVTDHFVAHYGFPVTDTRDSRGNGFTTLIGAELHAPETSLGEWWHILAVGLPLDFARPSAKETGVKLARRAAKAGAFVAAAHPAWYDLSDEDVASLDAAHAIEIHNSICYSHNSKGDSTGYWDRALARGSTALAIATDDAHLYRGYNDFARNWVMVKAKRNEPEAILAALHAGAFYSTQGPVIEDVRIRKGSIVVQTSPIRAAWLTSSHPQAAETLLSPRPITQFELPLSKFTARPYVRMTLADARGRRAYTNAFTA